MTFRLTIPGASFLSQTISSLCFQQPYFEFFMPPNRPQILNPASESSSKCFQGVCICSVISCSKTPSESLAHQLQNSPHWNSNEQHHIVIDISREATRILFVAETVAAVVTN